jgi:hypothetical protein
VYNIFQGIHDKRNPTEAPKAKDEQEENSDPCKHSDLMLSLSHTYKSAVTASEILWSIKKIQSAS